MPQTTIRVEDCTNIPGKMRDIIEGAKKGVREATESGIEFIKSDIFENQKFVGSEYYPDVKETTKRIKAIKGKELVGVDTGNLKSSFDSEYEHGGLTGIITGGGPGYGKFLERWQIDALFLKERGEETRRIIKREIKKNI